MSLENDLIEMANDGTKACRYPQCPNRIAVGPDAFDYCETCRVLVARNAITLLLDPCAPRVIERSASVEHAMLTNMTGEEIVAYVKRLEDHYLAVQKVAHLYKLSTRKPVKTLDDAIAEARTLGSTPKTRKEREKDARSAEEKKKAKLASRKDKLKALLGDKADDIMGENDW